MATRQKQVFRDASEVAHVWASRSQDYGRNPSGNIYFEGATIFSYGSHYPLGHIFDPSGRTVALINSRQYSVTTSGHQNCAASAVRHLTTFHVPQVRPDRTDGRLTDDQQRANLASFFDSVPAIVRKQQRARVHDYRGDIVARIVQGRDYAAAMNCRRLLTKRQRQYIAAVDALEQSRRIADNYRDIEWEEREAARSADNDALNSAIAAIAGWSADELEAERLRQRRDRERLQRAEQLRRREDERREALMSSHRDSAVRRWRAGAHVDSAASESFAGYAVRIRECLPSYALLRLSRDGSEVETSQGAAVSVSDARLAWSYLQRREVPPFAIGHYSPIAIRPKTMRVGCHTIPWSEIDAIAVQLGLLDQAAQTELSAEV
jgi:hypothetical protein